nr:MAG TPA: DHHW protein [Caudoviricetes sp.]DAV94685.1 MAG TPA: DHHW protein [Caudoviricetes sp.]
MSKLYKVTIFGESFLIGWFPFASHWYNKLKIIK